MKKQKIAGVLLAVALLILATTELFAQKGVAGLNAATREVTSYFDPATKLMYAVGAILGIVGAISVYNKWKDGDPDTGKALGAWLGACIFLVVVATVLRAFFL